MFWTFVDIAVGANAAWLKETGKTNWQRPMRGCQLVLPVSLSLLSKLLIDGIFKPLVGNSFLSHFAL